MTPAFSDTELDQVRQLLADRYQKDIELHLADSEILAAPETGKPGTFPTVLWHGEDANFVLIKIAESQFRARFFYTPQDQHHTETRQFDDLSTCVNAVLQSQEAHQNVE